jgi:hypothetical protein
VTRALKITKNSKITDEGVTENSTGVGREVRKNLRRRGYSDSFKIKCAFKAETEHTPETPSHRIPFLKSSSLASFRLVLNDALEKTFRIKVFSLRHVKFFLTSFSGVFCHALINNDLKILGFSRACHI